jgi:glycine cleavage system transcriptional repressor
MTPTEDTGADRWLLTVTGPDRPGIIAAIAEVFAREGADLEDASMTRLSGNFAMILQARGGTEEGLREGVQRAADDLGMVVHLGHAPLASPDEQPTHFVSAAGPNRVGIVSTLSGILARHGVNITEMSTRLLGRTKVPVYLVRIECGCGRGWDEVAAELARAGDELGVEVRAEALESTDM